MAKRTTKKRSTKKNAAQAPAPDAGDQPQEPIAPPDASQATVEETQNDAGGVTQTTNAAAIKRTGEVLAAVIADADDCMLTLRTLCDEARALVEANDDGNQYAEVMQHVEAMAEPMQVLDDHLMIAGEHVRVTGERVADQARCDREAKARQHAEKFTARVTIIDTRIEPDDDEPEGHREDVQHPAITYPSPDAAIAAWQPNGRELTRINRGHGEEGPPFVVTKIEVLDREKNVVETVNG